MAAPEIPGLTNPLPSPGSDETLLDLPSLEQDPPTSENPTMAIPPGENTTGKTRALITEDKSPEAVARAVDYWARLDNLIGNLESRVRDIETESRKDNNNSSTKEASAPPSEIDSSASPDTDGDKPKGAQSFTPEVRYCNYQQFVNRFPDDPDASCIEVLRSGPQLGK